MPNSFSSPKHIEEVILGQDGATVGTIRIKPSRILWKPANARKFHSVSLSAFADWITDPETRSTKTKS